MRLNLGSGAHPIAGYANIDIKDGNVAYPLEYADNTIEEIRASHILEHFSHTRTHEILSHWAAKLKPGGVLRISVPDLDWIIEQYRAGAQVNVQGYLMGGQVDKHDYHKCVFNQDSLHAQMMQAGLERIGPWESQEKDCSALAVSLNMMGYKPTGAGRYQAGEIKAILSAPRYGPIAHMSCASKAFGQLQIPYRITQGVYWSHVLSEALELTAHDAKLIITCDYDSIFSPQDVAELMRIMLAYPEIDALCPVQQKRHDEQLLFSIIPGSFHTFEEIREHQIVAIEAGHFGLTLFRADRFKELPKPWFQEFPNQEQRWGKGKIASDIYFWKNWREAGHSLYLAPKVVIGHMEDTVIWPNRKGKITHQRLKDYQRNGIPGDVR